MFETYLEDLEPKQRRWAEQGRWKEKWGPPPPGYKITYIKRAPGSDIITDFPQAEDHLPPEPPSVSPEATTPEATAVDQKPPEKKREKKDRKSKDGFSLDQLPSWVWIAGGAVVLLLLFRKK
jgi:hypothetical protein